MRVSLGMFLGFLLVLTIYAGMNIYAAKSVLQWIKLLLVDLNVKVFAVICILLALSFFLGFFQLPFGMKNIMRFIGSYWLGILIYLFLFFAVADLVLLLGSLVKIIPGPIPTDIRFFKGLAVVILTIGFICYGIYNANKIITVSYDIQLSQPIAGKVKIAMIADLHLGEVNSENRLENIVLGINNLKPDIVCIVGDIFNDDYNLIRNPDKVISLLKNIEAVYGVYAVLGNHDGGNTLNQMINLLEQSNIKLLNDEYAVINERLVLIGRLDPFPIGGFGNLQRQDITEMLTRIEIEAKNLPVVVMDHNPANSKEYDEKIHLILAGHTHRGQMFPGNLFTRAMLSMDYGHYQINQGNTHVIITQGTGTWMMPMRVGSNNEIVSIDLIGSF